jgi:hypothetical protein
LPQTEDFPSATFVLFPTGLMKKNPISLPHKKMSNIRLSMH